MISRNTINGALQGLVLKQSISATVVGNVFDEVGSALVGDAAAIDARVTGNIFLGARSWMIDAPDLNAGGNFWALADERATLARVRGRVTILPWRPASDAGY